MQIRVYEEVTQKPNGDRDTRTHPCSAFKVVLVNGDRRTTIFKNNQFDPWWTHINGTRTEYLNAAMKAAEDMAKTLGGCEIVGIELTKHEQEILNLQESIKRDQQKLDKMLEHFRATGEFPR
jgi:hypothetical protein